MKAGLRYGMFGFTAEERKQYGVLSGQEPRNADLAHKLGLSLEGGSSRPADPGLSEQEGVAGGTRPRQGNKDVGDLAISRSRGAGMADCFGRVVGPVMRRVAGIGGCPK